MDAITARQITIAFWLNIIDASIEKAAQDGFAGVFIFPPRKNGERLSIPSFVLDLLEERGFKLTKAMCCDEGMHIHW